MNEHERAKAYKNSIDANNWVLKVIKNQPILEYWRITKDLMQSDSYSKNHNKHFQKTSIIIKKYFIHKSNIILVQDKDDIFYNCSLNLKNKPGNELYAAQSQEEINYILAFIDEIKKI